MGLSTFYIAERTVIGYHRVAVHRTLLPAAGYVLQQARNNSPWYRRLTQMGWFQITPVQLSSYSEFVFRRLWQFAFDLCQS